MSAASIPNLTPTTPLSPDLAVVRKSKGPVLTLLEELYKIGPGPSSSHTMGPMRITWDFHERVSKLPAEQLARATALKVHLFGSLSATGRGHGTDRAALAGLLGHAPATCSPEFLDSLDRDPGRVYTLKLGAAELLLTRADVIFDDTKGPFPHPNTMKVRLLAGEETLYELEYYSVGGGFIEWKGYVAPEKGAPAYPYSSWNELNGHLTETGLPLSRILLENEQSIGGRSEQAVRKFLDQVANVMVETVNNGLKAEGVLPGPIGLQSKAAAILRRGRESHFPADRAISTIAAYALAGAEENARGHVIVTAPTAGSAGVLPAIVKALRENRKVSKKSLREGLLAAAAIGYLCKHNATLSGAAGGCQAEIGVASAMAAALGTQASGYSPRVVANAAESALEHHLGITCDPVAGYVQVPCIERCAFGAIKAWTASAIACDESTTRHRVDLDTCIAAMAMTAHDMSSRYKETSEAGLAALVLC
ncbi:MAG: L-serine ammonia-lyase [Thermoanaerobaculia bacterium]